MKLKVGDIFTIPISDEKTGFGQIIIIPSKSNFIIVVFEKVYTGRDWPNVKEIIEDKILFLGYTMDAKLYHNHWQIIGNETSNLDRIKLPYYKLGTPPDCKLVDYKGKVIGKIGKDKFQKLEYKTVLAPIEYELALKAYYKLGEWEEEFSQFIYDKTLESIKIVEEK